jgi:hypothetical protein
MNKYTECLIDWLWEEGSTVGLMTRGHHDPAVFVRCCAEQFGKLVQMEDVHQAYWRILPPNEDATSGIGRLSRAVVHFQSRSQNMRLICLCCPTRRGRKETRMPDQLGLFDQEPPQKETPRLHRMTQDSQNAPAPPSTTPSPRNEAYSESEESTWSESLAYLMSWGH